jgi:hypothetical protein
MLPASHILVPSSVSEAVFHVARNSTEGIYGTIDRY